MLKMIHQAFPDLEALFQQVTYVSFPSKKILDPENTFPEASLRGPRAELPFRPEGLTTSGKSGPQLVR